MPSRARTALFVAAVLVTVGSVVYLTNPALIPGTASEYERTTLTVVDTETGETLTTVDARVADTYPKRYIGLSEAESLGANEGMWFIHDNTGTYAYAMRDMDFPLDIIFVAENGTITRIHHAETEPEATSEADLTRYRGTGKYVLEVPYGYTNRTEIDVGDRIVAD
ncbi:DUF192 domain-containing protein [Haloferax mediterranei ATCC 33500]|uniref:DUF192 domain-containing protein n=1 Tax=Haloferax mediterranei (strain ATCC 33500 / DSM 1411 / JCM 8866 / NBRC 14739 / NCIMB 2177 / R-4) TaxID=523841 RepID=I3R1U9_HALMT|nr:DUF192 domain-containing protein [Haloferax mediterranei]AFK18209.1 hypothetical protein HFX_0477 [Haloferax mediterranei ATCC 33500]AHZ22388.1 hypothetical protein BM92_06875 [Haloferax mediterranei ATCC 33500]EMA02518.1 hypothetical protein C439_08045 [Haloferax mediterranei ATCC 33500]MDX5988298.1 DUF192 domain-containing protein [Haloferax mediterranei ATCC 33500]QCQ74734.1 DUF192 domain-containing protein [Haloferax mediterranei ATCC 33500]